MNSSKSANIQVWNNDNSASLVSDGVLTNKGKTYKGKDTDSSKLLDLIDGTEVFLEAIDEIPASIKKVIEKDKKF